MLTQEELWALHAFIRRAPGPPDYGKEWGKEFMLNLYREIVGVNKDHPVVCGEADLWMMTRQIPKDYRVGTEQVGRTLLIKVFTELLRLEESQREYAYDDDDGNSYNDTSKDDTDYLSGDGPGTESSAAS